MIPRKILFRYFVPILFFLKERFADQVDHNITLDEYTNFDLDVSTTHEILTKQEPLTEINEVLELKNKNESVD